MTTTQIQRKAEQAQVPFTVAQQIRELLDNARKAYGPQDWDDSDVEQQIIELVTEE